MVVIQKHIGLFSTQRRLYFWIGSNQQGFQEEPSSTRWVESHTAKYRGSVNVDERRVYSQF